MCLLLLVSSELVGAQFSRHEAQQLLLSTFAVCCWLQSCLGTIARMTENGKCHMCTFG